MSVIEVWCPVCVGIRPHVADDSLTYCTGCQSRTDLGEGLAVAALTVAELPVDDMRFCDYCRDTLPADHGCPYGPPADSDTP